MEIYAEPQLGSFENGNFIPFILSDDSVDMITGFPRG